MSRSYAMTVAPASLAALSWVPSCEPSIAPTTMTLAPLVTMDWIWFCCSETPPLANCTSPLKPAWDRPSLNSCSARTQFSEVFCGRATPMKESCAKPPDLAEPEALPLPPEVADPEPESDRPQPVRASELTAVSAMAIVRIRRISLIFLLG
jgi:hypothetical protein